MVDHLFLGAPPLKFLHTGIQVARADYTLTATAAVDDTLSMLRIPHGAVLIDAYMSVSMGAALLSTEALIEDDDNQYTATISFSNAVNMSRVTQNMPFQISLSDQQSTRFSWLRIGIGSAASAAATIGAVFTLVALYTCDEVQNT